MHLLTILKASRRIFSDDRVDTRSATLGSRILSSALPPSQCEAILGDLSEEFDRIAEADGRRAATCWYLYHATRTFTAYAFRPSTVVRLVRQLFARRPPPPDAPICRL